MPDQQGLLRDCYLRCAREGLAEDHGPQGDQADDRTTIPVVDESVWAEAVVVVKERGVVCGLDALDATMWLLDERTEVVHERSDGDRVEAGTVAARVTGPARAVLVGERTALNLVGHLSGIATATRALVDRAQGVAILDTRKTLPGLRTLQRHAVRCGGGTNHRFGLSEGVLVKDNHIVVAGSVGEAVRRAKASGLPVQCEVESPDQLREAVGAGADGLLLDNRSPDELRALVELARSLRPDVMLEASGGITLSNVAEVAATGVDRISVGALTHSARALDVSLRIEGTR